MNEKAVVHYVYDPFCGWCFGAAPLITAASEVPGIEVRPHSGGMLAGENARNMAADWREFVRPHEQRITALSGRQFGKGYTEGIQFDDQVRLDSTPPTVAMLVAEALDAGGVRMLKHLQNAYYESGLPIGTRSDVLTRAQELGYEVNTFASKYDELEPQVEQHFEDSARLLHDVGGRGYPTLALQTSAGTQVLHLGHYLGKPDEFRRDLEQALHSPTGLAL